MKYLNKFEIEYLMDNNKLKIQKDKYFLNEIILKYYKKIKIDKFLRIIFKKANAFANNVKNNYKEYKERKKDNSKKRISLKYTLYKVKDETNLNKENLFDLRYNKNIKNNIYILELELDFSEFIIDNNKIYFKNTKNNNKKQKINILFTKTSTDLLNLKNFIFILAKFYNFKNIINESKIINIFDEKIIDKYKLLYFKVEQIFQKDKSILLIKKEFIW